MNSRDIPGVVNPDAATQTTSRATAETRIGSGVQVQVSVQVSDPKNVPHAADILVGCLTDAHLKIFATKSEILPIGEVMLYVGVPEAGQ